jgi:hypothetical protein
MLSNPQIGVGALKRVRAESWDSVARSGKKDVFRKRNRLRVVPSDRTAPATASDGSVTRRGRRWRTSRGMTQIGHGLSINVKDG